MMDVLLDTCAVVWAILEPERLSADARRVLAAPATSVHVSPISVAEIACAVERGRITLSEHWKLWCRRYIAANEWTSAPIDMEIVTEAYSLPPPFHADPADRLIVATARVRGLHIVTGDRLILAYPHVQTVW